MTYSVGINFIKMQKVTCKKCKETKLASDFYQISGYKNGMHPWCRKCFGNSVRNSYLKRTYGIDSGQYDSMLSAQDGGCGICLKKEDTTLASGKSKSLAVDHDSKTGQIRGILCENCNRGIGLLAHDTELLRRATEYLNQY